jgi:hypothetical protein
MISKRAWKLGELQQAGKWKAVSVTWVTVKIE